MSLDSKKFRNNNTGEVVKVISSFEDIAILENRQKVSVSDLLNTSLYTEEIDPSSFFSNQGSYNILAEKIKSIPSHLIKDDDGETKISIDNYGDRFQPSLNESAVIMTSEEDEKAELARKYGATLDPTTQLQKQNDAFARILGDDTDELPQVPTNPIQNFDENIQRVEVKRDDTPVVETPQVKRVEIEDPIITIFKRTKRNVEFKVNFDFGDKIPRLDFIEMMEDSYETSIIDFLADEFTNKILQDPSLIRNKIKEKIKHLVYATSTLPISNNKKINEETQNNKAIHDQITDSVTTDLPKKTTTRRTRAKKETVEK